MSKKKSSLFTSKLDIIIPVYGRFDLLHKCLNSIPASAKDIPYNIVLMDNNSPDQKEANEFYSQDFSSWGNVLIVRNKENVGFPKSCNDGASRRNSKYIFFLNSDVILYEESIFKMVQALEDDASIGTVGMKLIFPPDDIGKLRPDIRPAGKLQHIGLASNIRGEIVHQFVGWSPDHPKVNAVSEVLAVTGAALMTRRSIWNMIGGFFEGYGKGTWEDVDYCLSCKLTYGKKIIVLPDAIGIHYTSATAETYGMGYPLEFNRMTFLQRWGQNLPYTEHLHW